MTKRNNGVPEAPARCPFCGSNKVVLTGLRKYAGWWQRAMCETCGAMGPEVLRVEKEEAERVAARRWSQRQGRRALAPETGKLAELGGKLAMLEKEADWLATYLSDLCPHEPVECGAGRPCHNCPGDIDCGKAAEPEAWRKRARRDVEETMEWEKEHGAGSE